MYIASYTHENFINGETVDVQESFDTHADAKTFLEQAEFSLYDHSLEWENSNYRIDYIS